MFYLFDEVNNDIKIKSLVGKKAASLVEMLTWGLSVPDGGCIITDAFEEFIRVNNLQKLTDRVVNNSNKEETIEKAKILREKIIDGILPGELVEKLEKFLSENSKKPFAVRSSGTKEDMGALSFAGQYTSILNVRNKVDLFNAVKECWASLYNERLITYCLNNHIKLKTMQLAVIVQEMIPAEKSGVIFTINPLKGFDKQMVIEAVFGLGEALVGGETTPDQYFYNWYNEIEEKRVIGEKKISIIPINEYPFTRKVNNSEEKKKEAVLDNDEIKILAKLALKAQIEYGFPVDLEWAKAEGKFYIVQCRPITKIYCGGLYGEWTTADFKDGGVSSTVCTPYMWSLYDFVFEKSMPDYLKKVKLFRKNKKTVTYAIMYFGRPYWNVHEVKEALKRLPDFVERDFDEDLGIEITYEGDGYVSKTNAQTVIRALNVLMALKKSFRDQMKLCKEFKDRQAKKLKDLESFNPNLLGRKEFFKYFESFIKEEFYLSEGSYFSIIYNNSNLQSLIKKAIFKLNKDVDFLQLMLGLYDVAHLLPNYDLWNLSRRIRSEKISYLFWEKSTIKELNDLWKSEYKNNNMEEFREFIKKYKYHSTRELDITVPRYDEDPTFVFETLKKYIDLDESHNPKALNSKQYEAYVKYEKEFIKSLPIHKRITIKAKIKEMRSFLWWREEFRDLSTRYYYEVRRVTMILAQHFIDMNIIKEKNDIFFLSLEDIYGILHRKMNSNEVKRLVKRNTMYYKAFRNFQNPNEIGDRFLSQAHAVNTNVNLLKGIPSSPGTITGKVKVILDIFDSGRLEAGDILITKFTDPGWTPKFALISAVATECGGLLSHAAVISREYGIPSVLAVKDITKIVKDGQTVTINGNKGEIIIHS